MRAELHTSRHLLAVQDVRASREFYVRCLGFSEARDFQAEGWSFLYRDGVKLILRECSEALSADQLGDQAFFAYIFVKDIERLYAEVVASGARPLSTPAECAWGMREFAVRTPDGHTLFFGEEYTAEDVDRALTDAKVFAAEGRYAEALERHLWYHRNALEFGVGQYGVRLSFALADWISLSRVYPPARAELVATRDEAIDAYRKDPQSALQLAEALSISFALDDLASAKKLFYEGLEHGVKEPHIDLKRVLASGDLSWARDAMGDPSQKLARIKSEHELMNMLSDLGDEMQSVITESNASRIAEFLRAVAMTHDWDTAVRIRDEALEFMDSPLIRDALKGT